MNLLSPFWVWKKLHLQQISPALNLLIEPQPARHSACPAPHPASENPLNLKTPACHIYLFYILFRFLHPETHFRCASKVPVVSNGHETVACLVRRWVCFVFVHRAEHYHLRSLLVLVFVCLDSSCTAPFAEFPSKGDKTTTMSCLDV